MRREHYVVFGAGDVPDKGVLGMKSRRMGGYELRILQLKNSEKYERGSKFDMEDVDEQYTTLYFRKKESLEYFIRACKDLLEIWDGHEHPDKE